MLIQLPPAFRNKYFTFLVDFLKNLPKEYRYVVEVRNRSLLNIDLYSLLKRHNVVLAWVDSPLLSVVSEITSDFIYIRWEGDRNKVSGVLGRVEFDRESEIKLWADKIKQLLNGYAIFGYFSKHYSGYSVGDAYLLLKFLGLRSPVSGEMFGQTRS